MAQLDNFNANEYEDMNSFQLAPNGRYKAIMVDSEWKDTKDMQGQYLNAKFEIIEGPCKGTSIFRMLNLRNKNETAVKIARQEMASICRATGVLNPSDSAQLHNKPIEIDVIVEPGSNGYKDKNAIKMYYACGAAPATVMTQTVTARVVAQDEIPFDVPTQPTRSKKPWEN